MLNYLGLLKKDKYEYDVVKVDQLTGLCEFPEPGDTHKHLLPVYHENPDEDADTSKNEANAATNSIATSTHFWMPDKLCRICYGCEENFTMYRRRHHCRICGQIFCGKCSNYFIDGALIHLQGQCRICKLCHQQLQYNIKSNININSNSITSNTTTTNTTRSSSNSNSNINNNSFSSATTTTNSTGYLGRKDSSSSSSLSSSSDSIVDKDLLRRIDDHFKAVTYQLLSKSSIHIQYHQLSLWYPIIISLVQSAIEHVDPNVRAGDSIDIRQYVQIKIIPGGHIQECKYINGLVFRKTVSHKRMLQYHQPTISHPKILLLSGNIEYQRMDMKLSSLEYIMEQESTYLELLIEKLMSLKPGKSVARKALELFCNYPVVVFQQIKPSLLEHISRMTGAQILSSTDHMIQQYGSTCLGYCTQFTLHMIHDNPERLPPHHSHYINQESISAERLPTCTSSSSSTMSMKPISLSAKSISSNDSIENYTLSEYNSLHDSVNNISRKNNNRVHVIRPKITRGSTYTYLEGCPADRGCTLVLRGSTREILQVIRDLILETLVIMYHLRLEAAYYRERGATFNPMYTSIRPISHSVQSLLTDRTTCISSSTPNMSLSSDPRMSSLSYDHYNDGDNGEDSSLEEDTITTYSHNLSSVFPKYSVDEQLLLDTGYRKLMSSSLNIDYKLPFIHELLGYQSNRIQYTPVFPMYYYNTKLYVTTILLNEHHIQKSKVMIKCLQYYTDQDIPLGKFLLDHCFQMNNDRNYVSNMVDHTLSLYHRNKRIDLTVKRRKDPSHLFDYPKKEDDRNETKKLHSHDNDIHVYQGALYFNSICKHCQYTSVRESPVSDCMWKMSTGKFLELLFYEKTAKCISISSSSRGNGHTSSSYCSQNIRDSSIDTPTSSIRNSVLQNKEKNENMYTTPVRATTTSSSSSTSTSFTHINNNLSSSSSSSCHHSIHEDHSITFTNDQYEATFTCTSIHPFSIFIREKLESSVQFTLDINRQKLSQISMIVLETFQDFLNTIQDYKIDLIQHHSLHITQEYIDYITYLLYMIQRDILITGTILMEEINLLPQDCHIGNTVKPFNIPYNFQYDTYKSAFQTNVVSNKPYLTSSISDTATNTMKIHVNDTHVLTVLDNPIDNNQASYIAQATINKVLQRVESLHEGRFDIMNDNNNDDDDDDDNDNNNNNNDDDDDDNSEDVIATWLPTATLCMDDKSNSPILCQHSPEIAIPSVTIKDSPNMLIQGNIYIDAMENINEDSINKAKIASTTTIADNDVLLEDSTNMEKLRCPDMSYMSNPCSLKHIALKKGQLWNYILYRIQQLLNELNPSVTHTNTRSRASTLNTYTLKRTSVALTSSKSNTISTSHMINEANMIPLSMTPTRMSSSPIPPTPPPVYLLSKANPTTTTTTTATCNNNSNNSDDNVVATEYTHNTLQSINNYLNNITLSPNITKVIPPTSSNLEGISNDTISEIKQNLSKYMNYLKVPIGNFEQDRYNIKESVQLYTKEIQELHQLKHTHGRDNRITKVLTQLVMGKDNSNNHHYDPLKSKEIVNVEKLRIGRLNLPKGRLGEVIEVYEDQMATIIAYSLASTEYYNQLQNFYIEDDNNNINTTQFMRTRKVSMTERDEKSMNRLRRRTESKDFIRNKSFDIHVGEMDLDTRSENDYQLQSTYDGLDPALSTTALSTTQPPSPVHNIHVHNNHHHRFDSTSHSMPSYSFSYMNGEGGDGEEEDPLISPLPPYKRSISTSSLIHLPPESTPIDINTLSYDSDIEDTLCSDTSNIGIDEDPRKNVTRAEIEHLLQEEQEDDDDEEDEIVGNHTIENNDIHVHTIEKTKNNNRLSMRKVQVHIEPFQSLDHLNITDSSMLSPSYEKTSSSTVKRDDINNNNNNNRSSMISTWRDTDTGSGTGSNKNHIQQHTNTSSPLLSSYPNYTGEKDVTQLAGTSQKTDMKTMPPTPQTAQIEPNLLTSTGEKIHILTAMPTTDMTMKSLIHVYPIENTPGIELSIRGTPSPQLHPLSSETSNRGDLDTFYDRKYTHDSLEMNQTNDMDFLPIERNYTQDTNEEESTHQQTMKSDFKTNRQKQLLSQKKIHIVHNFRDYDDENQDVTICKFTCTTYWAGQFEAIRYCYLNQDTLTMNTTSSTTTSTTNTTSMKSNTADVNNNLKNELRTNSESDDNHNDMDLKSGDNVQSGSPSKMSNLDSTGDKYAPSQQNHKYKNHHENTDNSYTSYPMESIINTFIQSLSVSITWETQGGKSKAKFAKTADDRFVVKMISNVELQMFLDFAPAYFEYMSKVYFTPMPSVLCKILGVYKVGYYNKMTDKKVTENIVVMENIFYQHNLTRLFDLKGSSRARKVELNEKFDTFDEALQKRRVHRKDKTQPLPHTTSTVLLDDNLLEMNDGRPIPLKYAAREYFHRAVTNDTLFLSIIDVVDYSILIGFNENKYEIIVGIIDYLRQYDTIKKIEQLGKSVTMLTGQAEPTIIQPKDYRKRFTLAMDRYFLPVLDIWTPLNQQLSIHYSHTKPTNNNNNNNNNTTTTTTTSHHTHTHTQSLLYIHPPVSTDMSSDTTHDNNNNDSHNG